MIIKNMRWIIVSLVALATMINYIDRNALALMWPAMGPDLGMDKEDYSYILSFFLISYAIGQAAFGKIFDVIGTKMGFFVSIFIWSVSIGLHAVVKSVSGLSILRATLGFGEAGNWPGATKSNAEWFPISERAFAQGIFNAGASMGAIISAPLITHLYLAYGWQATFVIIAALGALWIVPWIAIYKSGPKTHPWMSEEEREHILSGQPLPSSDDEVSEDEYVPSWFELLKHKQSWAIILSRFFLDPVWWLFVAWLPLYLAEEFGFDIKQIGLFAWVPYVGAALGAFFGGWLAGELMRRGASVNKARKSCILTGSVLMLPALILTSTASTPLLAVLLIAIILFGFQVIIGNLQTLPSDFFSGKTVGSLAGLGGTAAIGGVLVFTWLIPVLTVSSYAPAFIIGAVLVPLSALSIFILGGRIEPVQPK
ncbi:MFS transporter [Alteromonadaceae bacterium M269]|nr:MFS transporter [Alteromonadaceae bacterium M269]